MSWKGDFGLPVTITDRSGFAGDTVAGLKAHRGYNLVNPNVSHPHGPYQGCLQPSQEETEGSKR